MHRYHIVDAFTARPFAGNPAAVMLLPAYPEDEWLAAVAREMNLSETAFLVPEGPGRYQLRWFTPAVEVALCGHATLASAHCLWEQGAAAQQLLFSTRSGELSARRLDDGWIRLDFPATPAQEQAPPDGLLAALGVSARRVGKTRFDYLVEVENESLVRALKPDYQALSGLAVRGIMVTAPGQDYDFVSRFFAPGAGVLEDPVTGSAHCALAPYWSERLGKARLRAFQASPRGGELRLEVRGDRVLIEGQAVSVASGDLLA